MSLPAKAESPTFREAFQVGEFRAVFTAQVLSLLGDRVALVALQVLVYARTHSPVLAAAVLALTFLPHLTAAPLSTLADRMPRRSLMVSCDVLRALLVFAMAMPGVALPVLLVLLSIVVGLEAPFESARAAAIPTVLGERLYPVGAAVATITYQVSLILGSVGGGLLLLRLPPRQCLLLDAATFVASALVLRLGLSPLRPVGGAEPVEGNVDVPPRGVLRRIVADVVDAVRLLTSRGDFTRWLLIAWLVAALGVIPEALATTYAAALGRGPGTGGLLLAAVPVGTTLGALISPRLSTARHLSLVRPLSVLTMSALALMVLWRGPVAYFCLSVAVGVGTTAVLFASVALMTRVPDDHRGRVIGLASTGLMVFQGLAVLTAGAVADRWSIPTTLVLAGAAGLAAMAGIEGAFRRSNGSSVSAG